MDSSIIIAFDRSGDVYVADSSNRRIQVFTPEGQYLRTFSSKGAGPVTPEGQYLRTFSSKGAGPEKPCRPAGVAIDGDRVYVADSDNHRVSMFSTEGKFLKSFGGKGEARVQFQSPRFVHVSKDGFILVADFKNGRIQVF